MSTSTQPTQAPPSPAITALPTQTDPEFQRLLDQPFSAFGNTADFGTAQRMAKMLCKSDIVPEQYRGEEHLGNCVIAVELANRIGASVLAVMQNLYIVHGRPAWSSQFLISCVNASRRFSPLRYKMTGKRGDDSWGCIAWAKDKDGEVLESPEITIGIAKSEGWHGKNGSKWKTLPELMLRYRTATLFARLYAPELTMGINTADEVVDIAPVVTETTRPIFAMPPRVNPDLEPFVPVRGADPAKADAEGQGEAGGRTAGATPATGAKPGQNLPGAIRGLCRLAGIEEPQLIAYLHRTGTDSSLGSIEECCMVAAQTMRAIHEDWARVSAEIVKGGDK